MAEADITQTGLAQAMARFPGAAATLRRLALTDPDFREICEEYALAQESLARFVERPDAAERPEIGDYRTVIAELESEIGRFLKEDGVLKTRPRERRCVRRLGRPPRKGARRQ